MNDSDIDRLLYDAGYRYDLATGRYCRDDGDDDFPTEDIAEELRVNIDQLLAWEDRQQNRDDAVRD